MSGEGVMAAAPQRVDAQTWDSSGHAHGRWTGLFKLAEEAGELASAAADLLDLGGGAEGVPEYVRALENEIADAGAACRHAAEANRLDTARVYARTARRTDQLAKAADVRGRWTGLIALVRACSVMGQLLGKIGAFPHGTEHPDGAGNLIGRLEVAIADLVAAIGFVAQRNGLDLDHIQMRGDEKLARFREWFPGPADEVAP